MAVDEQLDRLLRELSKQSLGPIGTIVDQALSRTGSMSAALTTWLREATYNQPLITLLMSCQIGYLFARLGRRHARR
jgi:hypothetical protein